jgi:large subunit ribosomal protein L15
MDLSNLKPAKGSVNKDRRLGRGEGSGKGGTATRGHKGQKSRSGYSRAFGFEGGQMPLQRREYKAINLSVLEELAEKKNLKKVDVQTLVEAGLVSGKDLVKILGNGKLTRKLDVKAHAFSESAKKAIEALEGSTEKILVR